MEKQGFFVASTGQNVGKTTLCLGLLAGIQKRKVKAGFMKPVGQEQVEVETGHPVDKDVVVFKEHFKLKDSYEHMSPVLIPSGFTKDFLDKKIQTHDLKEKIESSYQKLSKKNDLMVVEGTGHVGVGSIIQLNNAQVAQLLELPVILIASGGLGSSFDELTLNKTLCDHYRVKVIGVILNRVITEKREMITHYMKKALKQWNVPLLGCIPYDAFLSFPSMQDLEMLFESSLITGEEHRLRHFENIRLVATSVEVYREMILPNQLIITPANREDIILATLTKHWEVKTNNPKDDLSCGMILTGDHPPRHFLIEQLKKAHIPMIYTPLHSHAAMQSLASFTAKIRKEDEEKITEAIDVVEAHVDFDRLFEILNLHTNS